MDNRLAWKSPVPCYEQTNPFRTEVMLRMLRGLDQSFRKSLHLGYRIVDVVRLKPVRLPRFKLFSYVCICHFQSVPSRYVPQASDDPRRACRTRSAFHLPPAEAFSRTLVPVD